MEYLYLQTAAGNAVYIDDSSGERVYTLERRDRRAVAFQFAGTEFLEMMAQNASRQLGQQVTWLSRPSIEPNMNTLDPNKVVPLLQRKLTQMHDVVYITESTFGTGVDLDLRAHKRRKRQRFKQRRQQRRYQTLVADVHHAFGTLAQLRQPYADGLLRQYKLGIIWHRELRRNTAQLYIVRARLGR